jgi:hypothetical protein
VKTTSGKSKPPPRKERVIKIYYVDGRKVIANNSATSLRDALIAHFESTYPRKSPDWEYKIVGNTMQVFKKGKKSTLRTYRALELTQQP